LAALSDILGTASASARTKKFHRLLTDQTWNVPLNLQSGGFWATLVGGGGAAGGSDGTACSGGGGAGERKRIWIEVDPGTAMTAVIGAGGVPGSGVGGNGEDTTFSYTIPGSGSGGGGGGGTEPPVDPGAYGTPGPNPFDELYLRSYSPVSNQTFYAKPNGVGKPAKNLALATAGYIDSVFGTRIYRGTDLTDTTSADAFIRHSYSRHRAWNADSSRYMLRASNGFWYLYNANTSAMIDGGRTNAVGLGALNGLIDQCEATWHPTDPNKIWYTDNLGGLIWYEFDTSTNTSTTLFNLGPLLAAIPGFGSAARTWWKGEGRPSDDGDRWALMVETSANAHIGMIMYDRSSNTILGHLLTTNRPDHISTSPCGQYAVPSWYGAAAASMAAAAAQPIGSVSGARAYDPTFTTFTQLSVLGEHSDLAKDIFGNSVFVSVTFRGGAGGAESDLPDGAIYYRRLDDGIAVPLPINMFVNSGESAVHISGLCSKARPGWAIVSKYGSASPTAWHDGAISAVELKPSNQRVLRLAHTQYSMTGEYFAEPQATVNDDLSRIGWTTDWGTGTLEFAFLGLPSWAFAAVPINLTLPTISGTGAIGQTLTATAGTWQNATLGVTGRWHRDGVALSGATALTYVITADGDHTYVETATNAEGSASAASAKITSGVSAGDTSIPTVVDSQPIIDAAGGSASGTCTLNPIADDAVIVIVSVDDQASTYADPTVTAPGTTFTPIGSIDCGDYGGARRTRLIAYAAMTVPVGSLTVTVTSDGTANLFSAVGLLVRGADNAVAPSGYVENAAYASGAHNAGNLSTTEGGGMFLALSAVTWYEFFGRTATTTNPGWTMEEGIDGSSGTVVPLYVAKAELSGNDTKTAGFNVAGGGTFIAAMGFQIKGKDLVPGGGGGGGGGSGTGDTVVTYTALGGGGGGPSNGPGADGGCGGGGGGSGTDGGGGGGGGNASHGGGSEPGLTGFPGGQGLAGGHGGRGNALADAGGLGGLGIDGLGKGGTGGAQGAGTNGAPNTGNGGNGRKTAGNGGAGGSGVIELEWEE
jgi:hypothetical protein